MTVQPLRQPWPRCLTQAPDRVTARDRCMRTGRPVRYPHGGEWRVVWPAAPQEWRP
jgi:hypothetical protein